MQPYNLFRKSFEAIKENRLAFDAPKEGGSAAKPESEAPVVQEKPEVLKARVEQKMEAVKKRMAEIRKAAAGTYDAELVQGIKDNGEPKVVEHEERIKKADLSKKEDTEYLSTLDKELDRTTSEFSEENLKAVKEVKAQIEIEKKNFAKIKEEVKEAFKKKIAELKLKKPPTDEQVKNIFDFAFLPVEEKLNNPLGTNLEKLKGDLEIVQKFMKEPIVERMNKFFDDNKAAIEELDRLDALGGGGKQAIALKEKMAKELIGGLAVEAKLDAKDIKEKNEQPIIMARVCDILNAKKGPADPEITPENIKSALRYYERGLSESGQEKDDAKKIIDLLVANKNELLKAGIKMDLLGGTDATDHKLLKAKSFHDAKAIALKNLLAFHDAGKLNVVTGSIDLTAGSATRKLIEEYVAETDNAKRYQIVKAHKEDFLSGGKIFDAALCLQRAEDMKKRLDNNEKAVLKAEESDLTIELGTEKKDEYRKSGISFSETTPEAEKKEVTNTLEFKDNKLTVKFSDEEKPREYTIAKPKEMTAEPGKVDDENVLIFTLGKDKSCISFDKDKKLSQGSLEDAMSLRRSHAITLDEKTTPPTIKIEAREKDVDHGYIYNSKTQELTVKNKDTAKVETYKINAPKDTEISTVESDDGDFFVEVVLNGKKTYFDFDGNGTLAAETYGDDKGKETDLLMTHDVVPEGKNINIKPKAPENKPAPAAEPEAKPAPKTEPAVQPPAAPSAPSAPAENVAAKELNTTLGVAKEKVEGKMKAVEDTIDKDETWVTKGTAQEKMAKAKADFKETFAKVRGLLGEAESFAKQNNSKEAKAKYEAAQTLLNEKLKEAQKQDSDEKYLADTTKQKIKELRDEIASQKKNVDAAFDKITK